MTTTRFQRVMGVCLLAGLGMGGMTTVGADADPAALQPSERVRAVAEQLRGYDGISNADETVRVSGSALNAVDKQIVLGFVEDVRARLEMLLGVSFSGESYRVSIFAEESDADRPCVINKQILSPHLGRSRLSTIRIGVLNPARMDPRDLAREVCDGYLGIKVLTLAGTAVEPQPVARWFADGLARYLDPTVRQDDAETVLRDWQSARLPPFGRLTGRHAPHASARPEIAAQLAAYWLSFPDRRNRLETLCRALADGQGWSTRLFSETASGITDDVLADRHFDGWLLDRQDHVLTPGRTHPAFVVRAYHALALYPGEDDVPVDVPRYASPALLVERRDEPWVRRSARRKAERMMRLSAGRGDSFRAAAGLYAAFFDGIIRGEPSVRLLRALQQAEHALQISFLADEEPDGE